MSFPWSIRRQANQHLILMGHVDETPADGTTAETNSNADFNEIKHP